MRHKILRTAFTFFFLVCCFQKASLAETAPPPQAEEPAGDFFETKGKRLWFSSEGKGDTLVLVPGGPGFSHRRLLPFFEPLKSSFNLVYFDPLGRGKSDRAGDPAEYSLDRDIEDIEVLRLKLGVERMHLLGHSYGALVAEGYAVRFPDHVQSLILASGVMSGIMWQQGPIDQVNKAIVERYPLIWNRLHRITSSGKTSRDDEYQSVMGELWPKINIFNPDGFRVGATLGADDWSSDVYFSIAGDDPERHVGGRLASVDFSKALRGVRAPVLVTFGRHDVSEPPYFHRAFRESIPQAEIVIFEGSGHSPHAEESAAYLAAVTKFLQQAR